jgi:phosphomannomutase
MNNDPIRKINVNNNDVNVILKSLQNIGTTKEHVSEIDSSLNMISGKIISKINTDSGFINDLTISNIGDQYLRFLQRHNIEQKSFLVVSDGNFDARVFSQVFASYLKANNVKVFFTPINQISNFGANFSNLDKTFGGMIAFSLHRSHKDILSISFFNDRGALLSKEQSSSFNDNMFNTIDLNMKVYDEKIDVLPSLDIDKYLDRLPQSKSLSNISISINNSYNMNSKIIEKFFDKNKITYSENKSSKPNSNKNIKKAMLSSMRRKDDVAISLLPGNNYFEMALRHKKQYKFFNLNDLSAVYLYYQTKYLKSNNKSLEERFIVTDISTSELVLVMAKKNKIQIKEHQTFYSDIYSNGDLDKNMLFATNGTNYFISKGQKNYISDPIYNLQIFLQMISFFKERGKTLYDIMGEITTEYGIFRHSTYEEKIDDVTVRKFFNITSKEMKLAGQKIIRFEKINNDNNDVKIFKVLLADKTKVSFVHSKRTDLLMIYLSLNYESKESIETTKTKKLKKQISIENSYYMDLVVREKKILEAIKLFKDDYSKKTFN